jgi:hypothetical protein
MGQNNSVHKCNFEDIQSVSNINKDRNHVLINTLPKNEQGCLIKNTIQSHNEETHINSLLKSSLISNTHIYIYGKNSNDNTVIHKYQQLLSLGFTNVYIYSGGIFEWLCLQDIYGEDEFPTTCQELDILKFKPISCKIKNLIEDIR